MLQADPLRERIVSLFDGMSPQLRQAARYIIGHPQEVALVSMRELARNAGVQPSTMTRLAKFLGLAGYDDIRAHHAEAIRFRVDGFAARAMQTGLAILKPYLAQADVQSPGRVAIGTVKGDLHDIGKNLVAMMLQGAGFEIIDLGANVAPEKFVAAVEEQGVHIVALSALLTTTMPNMKVTIEALKAAGLRDQVKVMIGGAPVTETYARQIGADGYAPDASRAVALARSLITVA